MKRRYQRGTAAALAAVLLAMEMGHPGTAFAAAAKVGVDESVYVNLDYYGKLSRVNVVKSISANGNPEFTDYGEYLDVTNMSGQEVPVMGDGSVTWKLDGSGKERLYYKGTLDETKTVLPWDFDVSYKLNGVPVNGDSLAGASGLVEINIKAVPNENAPEYYRNNMVLMVAVPVDADSCYSVEAEGAQTQTIGENTFAVFTALPGEDGDYTVRIGTDSFETIGVVMTMVPGTLKDLEHVQDLKESRDTWKESGDQLYDSMDQMAASIEAMRSGVSEVMEGLQAAERTRSTWSSSRDQMLAANDQALEALSAVSGQMEAMIPYIQSAKDSAEVVHDSMDGIVDILGEMQDPMRKLNTRLRSIRSDADDLADGIPEIKTLMEQLITLDASLSASEQAYVTQLGILAGSLASIEDAYYEDGGETPEVRIATPSDAYGITMDGTELLQALTARKAVLEKISAASKKLSSDLSSLLDNTGDSARYSAELVDDMDLLIEDLTALNDSLDMYYPDLQAGLDDAEKLTELTSDALDSGAGALGLIQETLKAGSEDFDAAARSGIRGSLDVLDKSLGMLDSTTAMRSAGKTMKDTLDQEWDDWEDETNFLNMDPNAEKVSFTSEKNDAPDTLQIVLRTEEISLDDDGGIMDAETETEEESPLQRMWNVLVKMWNAVVEIFRNR